MIEKKFVVTDENAEEYILRIGEFIKRKVEESKSEGVFLGISGGIDCSVVARLCQRAGVKISLVMMPDGEDMVRTTNMEDARKLVDQFGFDYRIVNIKDICDKFEEQIEEPLKKLSAINIRPRTRMTILYALAQNNNSLVIGTGNLAERIMGYFTKWGDGACDLGPLAMLTKTEVRILAKHLNVPDSIISKPPSAGLYEGQTDEDDMGYTYQEIDKYIMDQTTGDKEVDAKLEERIRMSAHKLESIAIFEE